MNEDPGFDHALLGSILARRWTEERPYFVLDQRAPAGWLEATWQRRPHCTGLDLHWSRREALPGIPALGDPT